MGLSLRGTTSGAVDINAPAVAGDNTITLPGTNGAANQFYKNSGTAGIVTHSSMIEDSSGNVGIGSIIPQDELDVHGNIITGGLKLVNNDRGNLTRKIVIGSSSVYHIRLYDPNDTTKLQSVFKVDGTVGIGTDNPTSTLSLGGNMDFKQSSNLTTTAGYLNIAPTSTLILDSSTGDIQFRIATSERMRLDSSGRLLVGTSSAVSTQWAPNLQVAGSDSPCSFVLARNDATVATDSTLAAIRIFGNDSNGAYEECARISAESDGDHGTGDKPTRLTFSTTADGASSPVEAFRVTSQRQLRFSDASADPSGGSNIWQKSGLGLAMGGGQLAFYTGTTERMRITSTGGITWANSDAILESFNSYTDARIRASAVSCNIYVQSYGQTGVIQSGTGWISASSIRIKNVIDNVDSNQCWEFVKNISLKRYYYKDQPQEGPTYLGPIAEEISALDSEMSIMTNQEDSEGRIPSYNEPLMHMKALAALQTALVRIETLETQNASLESRLTALEG